MVLVFVVVGGWISCPDVSSLPSGSLRSDPVVSACVAAVGGAEGGL